MKFNWNSAFTLFSSLLTIAMLIYFTQGIFINKKQIDKLKDQYDEGQDE